MHIPRAPDLRFPGPLVSLDAVEFSYAGAPTPVLKGISLSLRMGDRVGIVGINGSGKTTLNELITGDLKPARGTYSQHPRLRLGYYKQSAVTGLRRKYHDQLHITALHCLSSTASTMNLQSSDQELRNLLGRLGLQGRVASDVPVANLSGGQLVSSTSGHSQTDTDIALY